MRRRREVLFICLPGLWALFSSRWGSYLPREPIFFTDMFLAFSLLATNKRASFALRNLGFLYLFLLYSIVIFLVRLDLSGGLISIRDFAPYLYLCYAVIVSKSINFEIKEECLYVYRLCFSAIFLHFVWVVCSFFFHEQFLQLPDINSRGNIKWFSIRPDFDSGVLIILVGLIISGHSLLKSRIANWITVVFSVFVVIGLESRAAFISLSVALFYSVIVRIRQQSEFARRNLLRILFGVLIGIMLLFVSQTTVGQKFQSLFEVSSTTSTTSITNSGTANARINSWGTVWQYAKSEPDRLIFGVGFGLDYLADSGALRQLTSDIRDSRLLPRQPHNYWLNTLARLGLLGCTLILILIASCLSRGMRLARRNLDPLLTLSVLILLAILPIASLGVVLEAPFGAIAFAFSIGIINGKRIHDPV